MEFAFALVCVGLLIAGGFIWMLGEEVFEHARGMNEMRRQIAELEYKLNQVAGRPLKPMPPPNIKLRDGQDPRDAKYVLK